MYRIHQIKLEINEPKENIPQKIIRKTGLTGAEITDWKIVRESLDSRDKSRIMWVYSVDFNIRYAGTEEKSLPAKVVKRLEAAGVSHVKKYEYKVPCPDPGTYDPQKNDRPVVVGFGPCGIFCALILAQAGLRPVVIERGRDSRNRTEDVERFWNEGILDCESNVQFGEGGAGTFSDGKLTTGIKDFRIRKVLEEFHKHGAPKEILYYSKPHVGTDNLSKMVASIRSEIRKLGGEVRFSNKLVNVKTDNGEICGAVVESDSGEYVIETNNIVLAIGHSARDTFLMLQNRNIAMEQKSFSVGARIEHSQEMINKSQYGKAYKKLPAADYKMAVHLESGRGVYTFCMCPGGRVVESASEDGGVVTNGMSYFARDGKNANSALLVNVTPSDFKTDDPLAGMYFQREIEQRAFEVGGKNYNAPCQRVGDFLGTESNGEYTVEPTYKPNVTWVNLDEVFPKFITDSMREGIVLMDNKLHGFADNGAVITGPETRSSSPVRIIRDKKTMQSNIKGLYPCGEGAGYAGGIMSAAVDGIKTAEMVAINNGRGKNEQ